MTRDEYESRKRRLEEDRRAAVELIDAACRAQLRALELVWMMSPEGQKEPAALPLTLVPARPEPAAAPAGAPDRRDAAAGAPARRGSGGLYHEVLYALHKVPEEFDRNDVVRALGYEPHRGSLLRAIEELREEGWLRIEGHGRGNQPNRYRQLFPGRTPGARKEEGAEPPPAAEPPPSGEPAPAS